MILFAYIYERDGNMKKNKKSKRKILFRFGLLILIIYIISILINQQKTLNSYATTMKDLDNQIAEAKQKKEELENTKNNIDSNEYVEKIAREKLDMYLPNERIYINIGN